MSKNKIENEVSSTIATVNSAQRFIGVLSLLKKAAITATAIYVAVMVLKVYKDS